MIDYAPLWETMKQKNITTYALIHKHNIDPHTINDLKHNKSVTMNTLESLCRALNCEASDVVCFHFDEQPFKPKTGDMSPVLLLLSSYNYCKALDFELNHSRETLKDRVIYFVGCRTYEAIICCILKKI